MNKTADTILATLFADGRSIGHQKPVSAMEWSQHIGEAKQALMNDILALLDTSKKTINAGGSGEFTAIDEAELEASIRHYFGQDNQGGKT